MTKSPLTLSWPYSSSCFGRYQIQWGTGNKDALAKVTCLSKGYELRSFSAVMKMTCISPIKAKSDKLMGMRSMCIRHSKDKAV